jgi:hypothetical protein
MELVNKINDVAFHVNDEYALVLDDRQRTTYNAKLLYHGNVGEAGDDPKLKLLAFSIPKNQGGEDYFTVKFKNDAFYIISRDETLSYKLLDIIPIPRLPHTPQADTQRTRSQERAAHGRDGRGGSRKRKTARRRRRSRR